MCQMQISELMQFNILAKSKVVDYTIEILVR